MAVIQGNAYVESISYSLAHGATPSTCQIDLSATAVLAPEQPIVLYVGGSQWVGRITNFLNVKNESVGLITKIQGVDYRDDLACRTVFGQFNMIDKDNGRIYQINQYDNDPILDPDTYDPATDNWLNQIIVEEHISPRDLLEYLSALSDFSNEYSDNVETILYLAGVDWKVSIYNVYNLDWNTGIKIHAAMQEICTRLGIQFTILMDTDDRVLRFTVIGEQDYPDLAWEGIVAGESEVGTAINLEVDTGVWIVGDRGLNQYTDLPALPYWNQAWNELFWDPLKAEELCELNNLDYLTNTVGEFAQAVGVNASGQNYYDGGFVEARHFFNDFTIKDYLRTVPFKVYRLAFVADFITADEFNGLKHVVINPIVTPLVSDPGSQYIVTAASVQRKTKKIVNAIKVSKQTTKTVVQSGHRLLESTGHLIFDQPRFYDAAAESGRTERAWSDYLPDSPTVTCVFLDVVFREFFGTNDRIGTKHVPNLRIAKVITDPAGGDPSLLDPDSFPEFVRGDEKTAAATASDVALGYLWRNRIVVSGKETFYGFAGHVPTGEINRVSVSLNAGGITEQVTYSSDEPSLDYDPQIEQRRRIAQESLKREQEKLRTSIQRDNLHQMRLEAGGKIQTDNTDSPMDHLESASTPYDGGIVTVTNADNKANYVPGQPVVGQPDSTKQFVSTPVASIPDGATNIMGVCMRQTSATTKIPAVVNGTATALVTGPVVNGDTLVYDATNKALKKGTGGNVQAMQDQASTTPTLIPVRLGGGGAGSSVLVNAVAVANIILSGIQTVDGISCSDGYLCLVTGQTTATENGVYICSSSGPWTPYIPLQAETVAVKTGTTYALSWWFLTAVNTYTEFVAGGGSGSPLPVVFTIDGGGIPITTTNPTNGGATCIVPANCTIVGWVIESDVIGSITVDIFRTNAGPPVTSIVGTGTKPNLPGGNAYQAGVPTGWAAGGTSLLANDVIGFSVTAAATVKRVTLTLLTA